MIVTASQDGGIIVHDLVGLLPDYLEFKERGSGQLRQLGRITWDEARASVLIKDDKVGGGLVEF